MYLFVVHCANPLTAYLPHSPDFFSYVPLLYTAKNALFLSEPFSGFFLAYVPFCCTLRQPAYYVFTSFSGFFWLMYLFCTPRKTLFFYQSHSPDFIITLSIFNELLKHLSSYVYILFLSSFSVLYIFPWSV